MNTEEKFTLRPPRPQGSKNDLYLEGYGKNWGEKITFTVGVSYFAAAIVGLFAGAYYGKQASAKHRQLKGYRIVSTIARTASRYGNASAAASLMFCLTGKFVDLVFEEEIQDFGQMTRNIAAGTLTGALYKSTLGIRPMIVGAIIGAGAVTTIAYSLNGLNDMGIIKFRMEV
ncbi:unnamed protein product [Blepharisma stoltei]|uniref:Uncharacterized protein n=1 Tax=Blepharisma stoltei TaxID=1481888 RepID=A0AAU9IZT2_9CILI|nr:unnamed protein product [Blepharisma stoltei]